MKKVKMTRMHKFAGAEPHLPIIMFREGQVVEKEKVSAFVWDLLMKAKDSWETVSSFRKTEVPDLKEPKEIKKAKKG